MALPLTIPAVLTAAAAAAIAFAPAAAADDADESTGRDTGARDTSQSGDIDDVAQPNPSRSALDRNGPDRNGPSNVPKGWSNEALWSNSSDIFGSLPKPPIFAMD